ncbi:nuclear transport factor 2 family protein [Thiocapsa bogorovii]|uniref:nuclear transport factor 2 family protein n=1 Tax=Thiocapsa bogorovii TaxID=521689 RepID=UPI001E4EF857|nr:nuclear transport factor 2 family protein [Thiocapsa bogorovii]UHD16128.1 nuclear transport factor 2 family protein [Thiocapsa bogorovii]
MSQFQTPEEVEAAFYAAFETLDIALMGGVWAKEPSPVCVHPGGDLLLGRSEVLRSWREVLTGAEPPDLHYRVIQRSATRELAVHLVEELIRPSRSREEPNRILATNVYRQTAEGWRMTAHHASLPLMRKRPDRTVTEAPKPRMH